MRAPMMPLPSPCAVEAEGEEGEAAAASSGDPGDAMGPPPRSMEWAAITPRLLRRLGGSALFGDCGGSSDAASLCCFATRYLAISAAPPRKVRQYCRNEKSTTHS